MSVAATDERKLLTLYDVLAESRALGLELSERTFRYYAVIGLVPPSIKRASGEEDARVRYYPHEVVQRLLDIRELQSQGYTLRQIKAWFAMRDDTLHAMRSVRHADAMRGRVDASGLLPFFASGVIEEARAAFLVAACADRREETLRQSVMAYYVSLLDGVLGCGAGEPALQQLLAAMTPMQVEALIQPLRRWRDEELERVQASGEFSICRALRQMILRAPSGLSDGEIVALRSWKREMSRVAKKARRSTAVKALSRPTRALVRALQQLSTVADALLAGGVDASLLTTVAQAEEQLRAVTQVLVGWRALLLDVPAPDD